MNSLNTKNAVTAGLIGVVFFILMLWWAPLKDRSSKEKINRHVQERTIDPAPDWLDRDISKSIGLPNKSKNASRDVGKNEIDPEVLKRICTNSASIQKKPIALELLKLEMRNHGNKEEGKELEETMNKLLALTNSWCEDGKPKQ